MTISILIVDITDEDNMQLALLLLIDSFFRISFNFSNPMHRDQDGLQFALVGAVNGFGYLLVDEFNAKSNPQLSLCIHVTIVPKWIILYEFFI